MSRKSVRIIQAAIIVVVVAAALIFSLHLMQRGRDDDTVTIDPVVERKLMERERAILRTWIDKAFPEWIAPWRSLDARYDPAALQREGIETIESALILSEDEVHIPLDDPSLRALVSPDGTKYLEYTGGSEEGEPDSELTLVDAARKERQRLLYYGPSVRFDDAAWVDDDTIVLVRKVRRTARRMQILFSRSYGYFTFRTGWCLSTQHPRVRLPTSSISTDVG